MARSPVELYTVSALWLQQERHADRHFACQRLQTLRHPQSSGENDTRAQTVGNRAISMPT
jgi:hypothetical protein